MSYLIISKVSEQNNKVKLEFIFIVEWNLTLMAFYKKKTLAYLNMITILDSLTTRYLHLSLTQNNRI